MLFIGEKVAAQTLGDTLSQTDTTKKDTVVKKNLVQKRSVTILNTVAKDTFSSKKPYALLNSNPSLSDNSFFVNHPFFQFTNPVRNTISIRQWQGKEAIFYSIIALLVFFAIIKNGFYRYLANLLKTYFRTTLRQRQIKEQLVQSPLPSFLLNIFFLLSMGLFLALLLQQAALGMNFNFWLLFVYCVWGLAGIYTIKFVSLKLMGWIFQVSEAIDTYIFIVFTTNKIIGIALLPFLVLLAFTNGVAGQVALSLSIVLVLGLFAYRYFLSYVSIHRQVKISFFHFVIYLCAFEIAPLLLINKLLFRFLT